MSVQVLDNAQGRCPALSVADVVLLQRVKDVLAVSELMPTRPGELLDAVAADRLARLLHEAGSRVRSEAPGDVAERIVSDLHGMAVESTQTQAAHAVALFASELISRWYRLPVPVVERVVVDRTFATRDLVRSLHRTPLRTVLVLTRDEAQLHEGTGTAFWPVAQRRSPLRRADFPADGAFFRAVDSAMATHLRARPSPVLVAGDRATAERFLARSRASTRFAGVVEHDPTVEALGALAERGGPVLDAYLRSREHEALVRLTRTPSSLVAAGLDAVWLATRREPPDMLVVEEDFFCPARLSDDGDHLLPVEDLTAPDVLDDAVDEVVEAVLRRGGWVAIAAPGALTDWGRIALTIDSR